MRLRRATAMVVSSGASFDDEPFALEVEKVTSQTYKNSIQAVAK